TASAYAIAGCVRCQLYGEGPRVGRIGLQSLNAFCQVHEKVVTAVHSTDPVRRLVFIQRWREWRDAFFLLIAFNIIAIVFGKAGLPAITPLAKVGSNRDRRLSTIGIFLAG